MANFIQAIRPYLEAAYFLASIGLFVGVIISFRQLRLIKADIDTRNIRASKEKAIDAIECYSQKFVPLSSDYFDEWNAVPGLVAYTSKIGNFSSSSVASADMPNAAARFKLNKWLPALHHLESLCSYFVSGIADEALGFKYIGRSFCFWVERNYDVIALSRRERAMPHWQSIVELYQLWRPRLDAAELEIQKDDLLTRLRLISQALSKKA